MDAELHSVHIIKVDVNSSEPFTTATFGKHIMCSFTYVEKSTNNLAYDMTDMTLDIQQIFEYSLNHAEFFVTFLSILQSTHPHAFTSLGPLFFSIVSSYLDVCCSNQCRMLCLNGTYHSFSMGKK